MRDLSDIFDCHKKSIVEFIDGVRNEAYQKGSADAIRKFAEWMQENNYHIFAYFMTLDDGVDTKTIPFDKVLAEYGKEQK